MATPMRHASPLARRKRAYGRFWTGKSVPSALADSTQLRNCGSCVASIIARCRASSIVRVFSSEAQGLEQRLLRTHVVGEQQHQPGVEGLALFFRELAMRFDQGFVEVVRRLEIRC